MRRRALFLGWCVWMLLLPQSAGAQMYRWVDEGGGVHYSEGIDSVPERHRSRAVPLSHQKLPSAPEPKVPEPSSGITKIPFTPGSPILVNAKINGAGPITLLLDTGADRTVIAPLPLWRLGISTRSAQRGGITGVTGKAAVDLVQVNSVEVGEAKVGPLTIMAHETELRNADGLLGRDFLDQFTVTIDGKAGVVTLAPK
jgi:hypothetical protein